MDRHFVKHPAVAAAEVVAGPFFAHRGLALRAPLPAELMPDIASRGHVRVDGLRDGRVALVAFVVAPGSSYERNRPQLAALVEEARRDAPGAEVIVAASDAVFGQTNILAYAAEQKIRLCPHKVFACDLFAHVSVPRARVLPPAELEALVADGTLARNSVLPVMLSSDPVCVWAGAEPGQVVELRYDSRTTIEGVYYREVRHAVKPL